jgi:hypothetical protein
LPKTIESKLVIKSETEQAAKGLKSLQDELGKVGEKLAALKDIEMPDWFAGPRAGGGKRASTGGSPRSPNAPTLHRPPSFPDLKPPPQKEPKEPSTFKKFQREAGRFTRGAGLAMGAGSEILAGATQQITPAVAGLLMSAGGALSAAFGGLGAVAGIPMMAGGAVMTGASILARPALQHYGQFADTYRLLGEGMPEKIMREAEGAFTPDEAMRYAAQLHRVGATEGFGRMGKMRYGEATPEMLAQYFTTATTTGAAGMMKKGDYDYLAKVFVGGIAKDRGKVSMEQSIDTMTGLMQSSVEHLGDLSKGQLKELAVITAGMEGQRASALLRGPLGVRTMGGMMAVTAGEGGTPQEMFKWQAYMKRNPGGNYMGYLRWKAGPGAVLDLMEDFETMGPEGSIAGMRMFGKTLPAFESIAKGFRAGKISRAKAEELIEKAEKEPAPEFKATEKLFDTYTKQRAAEQTIQLEISKNYLSAYMKMETSLLTGLDRVLKAVDFKIAVDKFANGVEYFVKKLGATGEGGTPPDVSKGFMGFLNKVRVGLGGDPLPNPDIGLAQSHSQRAVKR